MANSKQARSHCPVSSPFRSVLAEAPALNCPGAAAFQGYRIEMSPKTINAFSL